MSETTERDELARILDEWLDDEAPLNLRRYLPVADSILAAGYKNYRTFAGSGVLLEVADERVRQTDKWGEQNPPNGTGPSKLPMPYGSGSWSAAVAAESLKIITECAAQIGQCTWLHILREEVFEAFAESDPAKLRAELIQVAAVAVQWVEAIDRSKK
jgi:hypothetical protein